MIKSAPISQAGTGSTMLQPFVNGLMLIMVCPSIKRIKVGDIFLDSGEGEGCGPSQY